MPHQCVRCNALFEDGDKAILTGCACGARLFFYIKKEKLAEVQQVIPPDLSPKQKQQLEEDILDMVGEEADDSPVILDFESIRVLKPGKYELDLVQLFQKNPLIFKLDDGKYIIDVVETFDRLKKKGK
jgi:predicted  nucleic acid-binding Zn-ribbon protein